MRTTWITLLAVLLCSALYAETPNDKTEEVLAGHSYHGEAFNEGPRQKPYLMPGLGQSKFKVSTENSEAQSFFNQGIDQLHGFWYFEAERTFRQVAILEPDCAMAYWGLAMANTNNEERAKKFIAQAKEKSKIKEQAITDQEKLYIEALDSYYDENVNDKKQRAENFTKKLEKIVLEYPDDIEAKAFLACQVWKNQRDIKIASHVGINSILDDIFEQNPIHPAHHYRIHLWDYENAEVALHSAAMCGPSLPDIAHMWHMPGHIYSRLKRYEDAVYQQEASARIDHRHMIHDWVLPDQIHNFAHNNEWCIRNLIHVGRINDAIDLATNMISLPRHPKYNTLDERGSSRYGRQRLFQVLSTYEMWDELIGACDTILCEEPDASIENIKRLRFLGRAFFRSGQHGQGQKIQQDLKEQLAGIEKEKQEVECQCRDEQQETTDRYMKTSKFLARHLPINHKICRQFDRNIERDHRRRTREEIDKAAKELDDQINVAKRTLDELEGHRLVIEKKFLEAEKKFRAAGQVDAVYRAYIRQLGGESDEAIKQARKYVDDHENEVQPQAMLAWLLWEAGKKEEAVKELEKLATISSSVDHDEEFFSKLEPLIQLAGDKFQWNPKTTTADDLGDRPDLNSLGPFRWQPLSAPAWQLLDSNEEAVSLSQFEGRPVVVIFYLGHGCLHCAEQLQAFAPKLEDFLDRGIEVIAISTDKRNGLKKSIESYGQEPLPIRLLANPELTVFKQYRAYDEFEDQALHGTFLIDGQGKIRWQDISYEPFMDPDFLLTESKRLLDRPTAR